MNILSLLSANSFLVVNKSLARKVGLDSAALFADLAGSQLHWEGAGKLVNGYFYRTQQDIEEQTTLSAKTQLRCLRILEDNGLVKTKLIGLPATKHYSIDQSCLAKLLKLFSTNVESSLAEREKLDSTKGRTIENIIIENNNIENISIEEKESVEQSPTFSPQKTNDDFLIPEHQEEKQEKVSSLFSGTDNVKKVKEKKENEPAENAKYFFEVSQILDQLEELTGVKYSIPQTKALLFRYGHYKRIILVLEQGYTLEQCIEVVKNKCDEWIINPKMQKYLTTETLFRLSNFEKYAQQIEIESKNKHKISKNGNQQQQANESGLSYSQQWTLEAIAKPDDGIGYFLDNPSAWPSFKA